MFKWFENWITASQLREADRLDAEAEQLTLRAARLRERAGRLIAIHAELMDAERIATRLKVVARPAVPGKVCGDD